MLTIEHDQFITQYVTTFLATWAANKYISSDLCDDRAKRMPRPPVEDAIYLARVAYSELLNYGIGPKQYSTPESQRSSQVRAIVMRKCYAVVYGYYDPYEVDSLWSTREKAEAKVRELVDAGRGSEWDVVEMEIG